MTTATTMTKRELLEKWHQFLATVKEWEENDSDDLKVRFKGRTSKSMSESVFGAFHEIAKTIDHSDFEPDAWPVVLAIDTVFEELDAWGRAYEKDPGNTDPWGSIALWNMVEQVLIAARPYVEKNVESVQQLASLPNMPMRQIATIYGWKDEAGEPDVQKVVEELANPGLHTKNWVNPVVQKRRDEIAAKWRKRCETFSGRRFVEPREQEESVPVKPELPEAPETVEELLRLPNITIEQVAKMKKMTIDEVRKIAAEARIAVDHTVLDEMMRSPASKIPGLQRMLDEQTQMDMQKFHTYPELSTMQERIDAMLDDRIKPGVIASALKSSYPSISYEHVTKRRQERRVARARNIAELREIRQSQRASDATAKPKRKAKSKDNTEAAGPAAKTT